ncbi:MAG: hypothetical protein IPK97_09640 [Ahniella sp.]|nr:hypothetical protein [Ahniella sp.]
MKDVPAIWENRAKKASKALLVAGALAGAVLAIKEFGGLLFSSEPEEYDEQWIPIVYADSGNFRSFLERNNGKMVKINSAIALDLAIPVNHLVHQECEMDLPAHAESGKGKTVLLHRLADLL